MASPFGTYNLGGGQVGATFPQPVLLRPGTRSGGRPIAGGIGAGQYEAQIEGVFRPRLQQRSDDDARARNQAVLQAIASRPVYDSLSPVAGLTPATSGMTGSGPVRALTITKDPELEADVTSILGQIRGADVGQLRRQPRSVRIDDVLGNELARFRQDVNDQNQTLKDFVSEFQRDRPEYRQLVENELAAIRRILAPETDPTGVAGGLASNLRQGQLNQGQVTRRLLNQLARAGKAAEIGSPGGTNSYLQREAARGASEALLADAIARTEMGRRNILDTAGLQLGAVGRGGDSLSRYLTQGLIPLQAETSLDASQLARLGQLGNLDMSNVIPTTQGEELMRRLALVDQANQLRRGIRYEGLESQFNTGLPSISPIQVNPLNAGGGLDLATIMQLLENQDQAGGPSLPMLNTTGGLPATGGFGRTEDQDYALANLLALQDAGLNFDMGAGSDASILGMPGSTRTDSRGNNYILNSRTGQWDLVGPDGLTYNQRLYQ